jgi:hypothetical protein
VKQAYLSLHPVFISALDAEQYLAIRKNTMVRGILILLLIGSFAEAGELKGVVDAQREFLTQAKDLEQKLGGPLSADELLGHIEGYLKAKKLLIDEVQRSLPEIKAQLNHKKFPTEEGLALSVHMYEFPDTKKKELETTTLSDLKKLDSDTRAAKAEAELTQLQETETTVYKELF